MAFCSYFKIQRASREGDSAGWVDGRIGLKNQSGSLFLMITGSRSRERELLLPLPFLPGFVFFSSFPRVLYPNRTRRFKYNGYLYTYICTTKYTYIGAPNAALSSHARTDRINCLFPWRLLIGPCSPSPCNASSLLSSSSPFLLAANSTIFCVRSFIYLSRILR